MVQGLGFNVQGLGFRVQVVFAGFGVQGLRFSVNFAKGGEVGVEAGLRALVFAG